MSEKCKVEWCERPKWRARGYCSVHYGRWQRGTDMNAPIREPYGSDKERFWDKVHKTSTCWNWTGAKHNGYGIARANGKSNLAHRLSYTWAKGEIPDGIQLDHMCHNRSCVRPDHLRFSDWETNGQNRAGANKNSKTGIRGVYWNKERNGWFAAATLGPDVMRRGPFEYLEDAEKSAIELRGEHMPFSISDRKRVSK